MAQLRKVAAGQPLQIPAETFNTFVDAAKDWQERQRAVSRGGSRELRSPGTTVIRNDSGGDVVRFGVLAVSGVVIAPADNLNEFLAGWAFTGTAPANAGDRIVITTEPIPAGICGRALTFGLTPVQLQVVSEVDAYAGPQAGQTDKLTTGGSGTARIYFKESGTGLKWGVVLIPVSTGGTALKFARITARAGTAPPWRYTGVEVEHVDAQPGTFTTKSGGDDLGWKLINLEEIGPSGVGVNPLHDDSIVAYWPMGSYFACSASHYKGTY